MRKPDVTERIRENQRFPCWKLNSWDVERYSYMAWIRNPDEQHGRRQIWASCQESSRQFNLNLAPLVTGRLETRAYVETTAPYKATNAVIEATQSIKFLLRSLISWF